MSEHVCRAAAKLCIPRHVPSGAARDVTHADCPPTWIDCHNAPPVVVGSCSSWLQLRDGLAAVGASVGVAVGASVVGASVGIALGADVVGAFVGTCEGD
jgi:hypothetical protein